tara:strand:+ start:1356 stop:3110 length:1755 start_codon:yes stop_codon:yes gene_type:complete
MPEAKPTADSISKAATHLDDFWREVHDDWQEVDEFLDGTYDVWQLDDGKKDPKAINRRQFRPPTAYSRATNAASQMLGFIPKIHRDPVGDRATTKTETSQIENFGAAVWELATMEEAALAIATVSWYEIVYGYGILELSMNIGEKPQKPDRRSRDFDGDMERFEDEMVGWNPFRIMAPHPSTVLMPWDDKVPSMAIKVGEWTSDALRELTEKRMGRKGKSKPLEVHLWEVGDTPLKAVKCLEYWSLEWHAMATEGGEMLFVERNWWGFVPYTQGFAGLGHMVTGRTTKSKAAPFYLAQGLFPRVVREALRHQAQGMSARLDSLAAATYPDLYTSKDPAELAKQTGEGDVVGGTVGGAELKKDDVWYLNVPDLPQYLERVADWIDRAVETATISDLFGGFRPEGVATVGQHAMLTDQGQKKFVQLAKQIDYMATVTLRNIFRLFIKMGETMTIGGNKLTPATMRNNPQISVTFEQLNLAMQLQMREIMDREAAQGLISARTAREFGMRIEDEEEEHARLLEQRLEESPRVQARQDKATAELMKMEEVAEEIEDEINALEAQEKQAAAGPGQGAAPTPTVQGGANG